MLKHLGLFFQQGATATLTLQLRNRLERELGAMKITLSVQEKERLTNAMLETVGEWSQGAIDIGKGVAGALFAAPEINKKTIKNPYRK